jgi:hypothetical protein
MHFIRSIGFGLCTIPLHWHDLFVGVVFVGFCLVVGVTFVRLYLVMDIVFVRFHYFHMICLLALPSCDLVWL